MFGKNYPLVLATAALLVLGGIFVLATKQDRPAPIPPHIAAVSTPTASSSPSIAANTPTSAAAPATAETPAPETKAVKIPSRGPLRIRKGDPIPELFPHQAQRDEINRLATLPVEQALLPLVEFLKHEDPLVREEARTALIRLSSPSAVPYLRTAAANAKSPEEAADLREAVDALAPASS